MMNLKDWLEANNLGKYAGVLEEHDIDELEVLMEMSEANLEEIGIPMGGRLKILKALRADVGDIQNPPSAPTAPAEEVHTVEQTHPVEQAHPGDHPTPDTGNPVSESAQTVPPAVTETVQPPPITSPIPEPSLEAAEEVHHSQTTGIGAQTSMFERNARPKASSGSKATAIVVTIAIHIIIALVATLLVILPPSKDEPEIVAFVAPQSAVKQEMKQKNVQKQVKRTPSSSSAAAAPMALMMKASAASAFTTPDIKTTSTGPLGVGVGELGNGAFGAGTGLGSGDGAGGGAFFGTATSGNLAVIFDVTNSMGKASRTVVAEINRTFKTAHVVCVFGARFTDQPAKLVSYQSNKGIQEAVMAQRNIQMNRNMLSLSHCDSLLMKTGFSKDKVQQYLNSLGTAMEALLTQERPPGTIFVFSDYRDGADPKYMEKVAKLVKKKKVKIVIWYPFSEVDQFRDRKHYETFVKTVGGELKMEEL